ncbi:MAG TPA: glycosyltransferase [Bryobacteraceae bacterium]|nr:glycosyltransferase [Bryobacteraceae bacterium]
MSTTASDSRPVELIIPFYRNANLVSPLFASLQKPPVRDELSRLHCSLILINDSPGDEQLKGCLAHAVAGIGALVPCEILENDQNIGFVRSVNRALQLAVERKHDAIVLNSDALVYPGAIAEMCEVAQLDPMIGFVSPRSNNASICSLPHQEQYKKIGPAESHRVFSQLSKYLPRFHFVPVGVGFCLFIRWEVLTEFGLFDEAYSPGYDEENDLMMRANRCGYRAALANRAWVYHAGGVSFSSSQFPTELQEEKNAAVLNTRYPEYKPSIERYCNSAYFQAELLLGGLLPDQEGRLDLVFDLSSLGQHHNGTFLASKKIVEKAAKLWPQFNLYVMTSEEAWEFHKLDQIERIRLVPINVARQFAVAFRFSQPFSLEQMSRLSRLAPVNVYGMFDPIAFDCLYLNNKNLDDLETLWATVFAHADGVIYISDFVAELFRRRFRMRPGLPELVAYPSLDFSDYRNGSQQLADAPAQHILVIGNRFEHKRVRATTQALSAAFPQDKIVALGFRHEGGPNVVSFDSGNLEERELHDLLAAARFVVFPSTYEGFGFPVVESLAWRKPVLARSIPVFQEIREKICEEENLILYSSTGELIERLKQGFPAWRDNGDSRGDRQCQGWDAIASRIGSYISEIVRATDFERILVPRIHQMQVLGQLAEDTGNPAIRLRGAQELASALHDRETQIREIHGSWSWRLTWPIRKIGSAFLRMRRQD